MNVLCVCLLRTAPMCFCSHCLDTVSTLSKKKHKRVLNDWRSILFWWKTTAWNHSEIFLPLARALGVVFFRERFEFHHLLFPKSPRTLGQTTCNVLTTWTLVPYDRGTQLYRRKITLIFVISSGYQRLVGFSVKVTAKVNVLFNFDSLATTFCYKLRRNLICVYSSYLRLVFFSVSYTVICEIGFSNNWENCRNYF